MRHFMRLRGYTKTLLMKNMPSFPNCVKILLSLKALCMKLYFIYHLCVCCNMHRLLTIFTWLLLFTGNRIRVCCVGGGPGSEIIGLVHFLRSIYRDASLTCHVLDKFPVSWMNIWKIIQPSLPPSVSATYLPLDITSPGVFDFRVAHAIRYADIVTFLKSVSPVVAFLKNQRVWQQSPSIRQYGRIRTPYGRYYDPFMPAQSPRGTIPDILSSLKPGALVIYIDKKNWRQKSTVFRNGNICRIGVMASECMEVRY